MNERAPAAVIVALKEALERQIAANDPPETAVAFERLRRDGISTDESWRWLMAAMLQEMTVMVRENRPFDRQAFAAALDQLPGLIER